MAGPLKTGPPELTDRIDVRTLPERQRLAATLRRSAMLADGVHAFYLSALLTRAAHEIDDNVAATATDGWKPPEHVDPWGGLRGWVNVDEIGL